MSAPDTCRKCGSQFRALLPGVGIQFGCATIVLPVGGYAEGLPCVMRQRDQLAERVKRLEEVGDKMAAAFDKEWLGDADIECIQDDWDEAKGQP